MDQTDRAIIECLQQDGRLPYTDIAARIGVSEGTVRNRLTRLAEAGIVKVVALLDPHKAGFYAPAMIGLTVEPDRTEEIAEAIRQFEEVSYLVLTSGAYDLIVEVMCPDVQSFRSFLQDQLRRVPGILRTESYMILHTYKYSYGRPPPAGAEE